MPRYIDLDKLNEYPIRLNHYDKANGNINFVYGIESVLEYANSIEVEPMPQYVKLDSVINDIKKECLSCRYKDTDNCQDCTIDRRIHSIEQMCSSEPLYWETWAGDLLKCPVCGYEYTDAIECTNFCGNCGVPLKFKEE